MASLATDSKPAEGEHTEHGPDTGKSATMPDTQDEAADIAATSTSALKREEERKSEVSDAPAAAEDGSSPAESGEASPVSEHSKDAADAPPLPAGPPPAQEDDGWDCHWDAANQAWFFYNRFTNATTWENPRVPESTANDANKAGPSSSTGPEPPKDERPPAGGYNPAIHGDYDPNAWYARPSANADDTTNDAAAPIDPSAAYATIGSFNRFNGRWQADGDQHEHHGDEAKSRRQMNAFFDVDAAANSHDGRSLKAERSGKKPSKSELKQFKEKRKAKKEEKRRAWLRD
jgi:hypothetical protein